MAIDLPQAIEQFWAARARGEYFPREYHGRLTSDDAYRIQLALIGRRIAAGERQIGWKVGLTAKAIQDQFGFHEPVFGCVLDMKQSGHVFSAGELIHPGFESELCVRLGSGLEGDVTLAQVAAAADAVYPSFEIIETRGDFSNQIPLALADNAQQRTVVLGAPVDPRSVPHPLDQVTVRVHLNGEEVAEGSGAAVLANPLNSIVWLARKLSEYGRALRAGDIVMTGSFVRQFPLKAGDFATAEFSGIGRVEVRIGEV